MEGGEGGEEGSRRGRHEVERHFFFLLKNPDRLKKRTKDVRKNIVAKRTEQKKNEWKAKQAEEHSDAERKERERSLVFSFLHAKGRCSFFI